MSISNDKTLALATQSQNLELKKKTDSLKHDTNVENQKYHYMSGTRIYIGYISYIFKALYIFIFLTLILSLMYSNKDINIYIKLIIVVMMFIYPLVIGYTYPWVLSAFTWIKQIFMGSESK